MADGLQELRVLQGLVGTGACLRPPRDLGMSPALVSRGWRRSKPLGVRLITDHPSLHMPDECGSIRGLYRLLAESEEADAAVSVGGRSARQCAWRCRVLGNRTSHAGARFVARYTDVQLALSLSDAT